MLLLPVCRSHFEEQKTEICVCYCKDFGFILTAMGWKVPPHPPHTLFPHHPCQGEQQQNIQVVNPSAYAYDLIWK